MTWRLETATTVLIMTTLTTKHQRLAALRPFSPESVASLAAAWDVREVTNSDQFPDLGKLIRDTQP
jgi:hypothetical protein